MADLPTRINGFAATLIEPRRSRDNNEDNDDDDYDPAES
jgi:hypothetical protein